MSNIISKIKNAVITEREIICISDCGIKSKRIGSIFLIWNILLVLWTAFATVKYFDFREKIVIKKSKIIELTADKQRLLSNVIILEKNVQNIKHFLSALNKYDRFNTLDDNMIFNDNVSIDTNNVNLVLSRVKDDMSSINLALINRINGLEGINNDLNINSNIKRVSFGKEVNIDDVAIDKDVYGSIVLKNTIDENIAHLDNLEKFINAMPVSEPIVSTYVSSKYGKRLDPFLKITREHHGVDLVGPYMTKIYSSAPGKVTFVGDKGGYGKTIIIEHDHNVKTIYGHLNSYNVKAGDLVSRGDEIGVQGNTGRSTGHHLHYEIIKDNQRYNPMEFVRVGNKFY